MSPLSQYVQALAGRIHVKIKNNLLQPRSFDRDEHYAQTEEQTFTLSDYIALAVIKEGVTGKDKLCQSWRPVLTLEQGSCLSAKACERSSGNSMQASKFLQFTGFCFEKK